MARRNCSQRSAGLRPAAAPLGLEVFGRWRAGHIFVPAATYPFFVARLRRAGGALVRRSGQSHKSRDSRQRPFSCRQSCRRNKRRVANEIRSILARFGALSLSLTTSDAYENGAELVVSATRVCELQKFAPCFQPLHRSPHSGGQGGDEPSGAALRRDAPDDVRHPAAAPLRHPHRVR